MLIPSLPSMPSLLRTGGPDISTDERRVWAHDAVDSQKHLLGQHTVKLSPISYVSLYWRYFSFLPKILPHIPLGRLTSTLPTSPSASPLRTMKSSFLSSSITLIRTLSCTPYLRWETNRPRRLSPSSRRSSQRLSSGGGTTSTMLL